MHREAGKISPFPHLHLFTSFSFPSRKCKRQQQMLAPGAVSCWLAGCSVGSTRLPKLVSVSKVWNEQAPGLALGSEELESCKPRKTDASEAKRKIKKKMEKKEKLVENETHSNTTMRTRTRTKFVADVVKNWQQMLLNFKRNFTYLSCGAHSLRCSFERSFRQPTSCSCNSNNNSNNYSNKSLPTTILAASSSDFSTSDYFFIIFFYHCSYLIIHQNFGARNEIFEWGGLWR